MWRFVFIAFPIAHGAIHLAMWIPQPKADAPFDAGRSWLIGNQRSPATNPLPFAAPHQ